MLEIIDLLQGIVERGLIFTFVVAAVYVASRVMSFDNLSIEGAFGLGGALTALLINKNISPWLALCAGACGGGLSGVITGILHTQCKLNQLMSGIVVTTGLFSITLKVANANMPLGNKDTIFNTVLIPQWGNHYIKLVVLMLLCYIMLSIIKWFLRTEIGFVLQALGHNPQILTSIGKNRKVYTMIGLGLSNLLAALGGALFVQYTHYFSIWASVGILIMSVAGLILAEIFGSYFGAPLIIGAIIYQSLIAFTLELELDPAWNKLVSAVLIIVLIIIKQYCVKNEEK